MRLPVRLNHQHPLRKTFAAVLIAAIATILASTATWTPGVSIATKQLDNTFYDAFYKLRKPEDRSAGQIVLVIIDEGSLEQMNEKLWTWPWPRDIWMNFLQYLEANGARAVVFDLIMKDRRSGDPQFGKGLDNAHIPVVMANRALPNGQFDAFRPAAKKPVKFGAINVMGDIPVRHYITSVAGQPSLATETAQSLGKPLPNWADHPFLLHYYGPTKRSDGKRTYPSITAAAVIGAIMEPGKAAKNGFDPTLFKDKIVVIGGSAQAIYDSTSSPIAEHFPGFEVQATAIDNILSGQYVHPIGGGPTSSIGFLAAILAGLGVILPRRVTVKILSAIVVALLLVGVAVALFVGHTIYWLPMAAPLLAFLIATIGAFAWSYLTEDRQRRFVFKALAQYVSPAVAAEISQNPDTLKLGGERREMTVLFSDIKGFTDLSETMDSQKLSALLNYYLGEMSAQILANNGTLDKYIGDAIMSFWNAPLLQEAHAILACRAALAMRDREAEIQPQLAEHGAKGMLTRIGVNTGPMVFGNMGSPQKFNYSVLGDSVNLGSRLEGANKLYNSRILISDSTAQLVKGKFVLRQLDVLRVKGREQPLAVYELLAEGTADAELARRIEQYGQAFSAYQAQRWDEADGILKTLSAQFPQDLPAAALQERIGKLRKDSPPADWDGVYVAKDK